MARRGKDLFDRAILTPVTGTPSAADIMSGKVKWSGNQWVTSSKTARKAPQKPRAEAKKPKEAPEPQTGRMTRAEAERVASTLSDPVATAEGKESVVRERVVRLMTGELPQDPNKWDVGGRTTINKAGISDSKAQVVAYALAKEQGLLKGGERDIVRQVEDFESRIGSRSQEREYQIVIDRDGNRIHAIRGDKSSVGMGVPTDSIGRPIKALVNAEGQADMRRIYAGSNMHHNHPRQGEPDALGMTFSAGDISNTVRYARAGITATAREGVYIGRNRNWEEHAKGSLISAVTRSRELGSRIQAAEKLVIRQYENEVRSGRLKQDAGSYYRFAAPRLHAANIVLSRNYGIDIEFKPKAGFEWIASEAQQLVDAATAKGL